MIANSDWQAEGRRRDTTKLIFQHCCEKIRNLHLELCEVLNAHGQVEEELQTAQAEIENLRSALAWETSDKNELKVNTLAYLQIVLLVLSTHWPRDTNASKVLVFNEECT